MTIRVILLLLSILLVIENAIGFVRKKGGHAAISMGRPFHGFRPSPWTEEQMNRLQSSITSATIQQPVDHFNSSDTRQWSQRYYYNMQWYQPGGPIFLMIGGEDEDDGEWTVEQSIPFIQWAIKYHAAVYDIEHRFYGHSRPFPVQSTANLKYLTSHQAIEDAAAFIRYINQQNALNNPKWIVFGGSYAGILAAWLREKHPELVYGAVASSAPVESVLDYYGYFDAVENSLGMFNPKCPEAVRQTYKIMSELMWTPEGRDILTDTLSLHPRFNETRLRYKDIQNFFHILTSMFQLIVQYNTDNTDGYARHGGIIKTCEVMTNESMTYLDRLKHVHVCMEEIYNGVFTFSDISYDEMINYLRDDTYGSIAYYAASRSWTWQTCNEFPSFQSSDQGGNIFGSVIPVSFYVSMCLDVFGEQFHIIDMQDNVHETQKFYGGRSHFNSTNVVFTNGNVDPWHALGLYFNIQPSIVSVLIEGTAHCADMYPPSVHDPPGLQQARQIIGENIGRWVREEQPSETVVQKKKETNRRNTPSMMPTLKTFKSTITELPLRPFKEAIEKVGDFYRTAWKFSTRPPFRRFLQPPNMPIEIIDYPDGFVAGNITTPLDNFDLTNTNTFQQRFWFNPQYYRPGGPQFLFIGGEGPADAIWVLNPETEMMNAAKQYNAAVFMLEHRYYGKSWATPDQSNGNMQWLTSKQAITDLARFIMAMNERYQYENPKWITFGGSYPGMLSAWFRQMYPELAVGAVASSAPIEAKVDFFEYLIDVEEALRNYSPECADNIKVAFEAMHQLSLTQQGRILLSDLFKLDPAWNADSMVTNKDMEYFFSNIYGIFQGAVQYNNDYIGGYGIKEVCNIMLDQHRTPLENVGAVNNADAFDGTDNLYDNLLQYLKDVDNGNSFRSWIYQSCNEFGFFQSTDIGGSIFGSPVPVNFFSDLCLEAFGSKYNSHYVYEAIDETNRFYGGRDYFSGTNVVFINGDIDPWHYLGKYNGTGTVTTILMNGTAHCADFLPPRAEEASDLAPTRQHVLKLIGNWISVSTAVQTSKQQSTSTNAPQATSTAVPPRTGASTTIQTTKQQSSSTNAPQATSTAVPPRTATTSSANQLDYSTMNGIVIALVTMLIAKL